MTREQMKKVLNQAELVEKQIENVQLCYDVIAQKYTATGGNMWQIDANYLKSILNKQY